MFSRAPRGRRAAARRHPDVARRGAIAVRRDRARLRQRGRRQRARRRAARRSRPRSACWIAAVRAACSFGRSPSAACTRRPLDRRRPRRRRSPRSAAAGCRPGRAAAASAARPLRRRSGFRQRRDHHQQRGAHRRRERRRGSAAGRRIEELNAVEEIADGRSISDMRVHQHYMRSIMNPTPPFLDRPRGSSAAPTRIRSIAGPSTTTASICLPGSRLPTRSWRSSE